MTEYRLIAKTGTELSLSMGSAAILSALTAFLLGSIPFGYILVRVFLGADVRQTGSGNIGATNVARTGSKGLAVATLLLDALKGYVAVRLAFWLLAHVAILLSPVNGEPMRTTLGHSVYFVAALAALFAILGHMFTPWLRFKGGKGVATAVGAFVAISPRAVLVSLVLFILIVAASRYVSLGSIVAAAVFPFAAWWLNPLVRSTGTILLIAAASLLIIVKHKDNIRRLLAGTENRFR